MKNLKTTTHIVIVILLVLGISALKSHALNSNEDLAFFTELINEIRMDPFTKAESLGYDRETLKQTLPWLQDSYPPYNIDNFLNSRAIAHNAIDEEISEPGLTPEYDYAKTGETGGVITFLNFLSPDNAFKIIVENIFKQELNPERVSPLHILSTEFHLLGIDVNAGVEMVDDNWRNAYFVTICFGSSILKSEIQLLTMANQIRSRPLALGAYLNPNATELIVNNLNFITCTAGYPPLFQNSSLNESAKAYSRQLITIDRDSSITLSDDPLLRALEMGYNGIDVAETFVLRIHSIHDTSSEIAKTAFAYLLQKELKATPTRGGIFSLTANQSGVGISLFPYNDHIVVASSSINAGTQLSNNEILEKAKIYGIVYSDDNYDTVYTPGEEKEEATIVVFNKSENIIVNQITTDRAGHFTMTLDKNKDYRFETSYKNTTHSVEIYIEQNMFLPIEVTSLIP